MNDAYLFSWKGESLPVTFSPKVFDEHPDTIRFLSYGSPLLADLLAGVPETEEVEQGALVRCRADGEMDLRAWFIPDFSGKPIKSVKGFMELKDWLEKPGESAAIATIDMNQAKACLQADYDSLVKRRVEIIRLRRKAEYLTLKMKAQYLLLRAALVEIALGRSPVLFETEIYPSAFTEGAVLGLQRHGFTWKPLLVLAREPGLKPEESDPYFQKIASDKHESLKGRFNQHTHEARHMVQLLSEHRRLPKKKTRLRQLM